jgi:hypothetical protein
MTRSLFFTLLWIVCSISAQAEELRVLFIGNSYTAVHCVPEIVRIMAESKGHELEYEQHTPGGRTFQQHWEDGQAVTKIQAGEFDVVVLQNQSFEPAGDPANMMKFGKLLAAEVDKIEARKLFYLTPAYRAPVEWMKKDNEQARRGLELFPEMLDRIVASYTQLAKETDGEIAPVGVAWKLAYDSMPDLALHRSDNSHASEVGAYLTALVFYACLFDEAPSNMPAKLSVQRMHKGKEQVSVIDVDDETRSALEVAASKAWINR